MSIEINKEYRMKFPFKKIIYGATTGNKLFPATDEFHQWDAGCWLFEECDGSGYGVTRDFYGNAEGEVVYKVLSIAKMPDRFMDRIIFKRWLIDPDGKKYNNGEVKMTTVKGFEKDINSKSPFRADYEIDPDAKN